MKLLGAMLFSAMFLAGQSVWIPRAGGFRVTTSYTNRSYRDLWVKKSRSVLASRYWQQLGALSLEYGIGSRWALDSTLGFSRGAWSPGGVRQVDQGLTDTNVGVRYQLLNEIRSDFSWMPTVTVRMGAIVKGNYQPNRVYSIGDGTSGVESSVLFGKAIRGWNAGFFGDAGYRNRGNPVPSEWFASMGAYRKFGPVVLSAGYRDIRSLSGVNLREPGFTFQRLREDAGALEAGMGIVTRRGVSYQFVVAKVVDGRNTARSTLLGFSTSFAF